MSRAFNRWITRGMAAAGYPDLGALDVMVLHTVNHRANDKKLADLLRALSGLYDQAARSASSL